MGKSPKPLRIVVDATLATWDEFEKLKTQGHEIVVAGEDQLADLVLAPTAWRMDAGHRKYLSLAIAAGRKRRYPKEKGD